MGKTEERAEILKSVFLGPEQWQLKLRGVGVKQQAPIDKCNVNVLLMQFHCALMILKDK